MTLIVSSTLGPVDWVVDREDFRSKVKELDLPLNLPTVSPAPRSLKPVVLKAVEKICAEEGCQYTTREYSNNRHVKFDIKYKGDRPRAADLLFLDFRGYRQTTLDGVMNQVAPDSNKRKYYNMAGPKFFDKALEIMRKIEAEIESTKAPTYSRRTVYVFFKEWVDAHGRDIHTTPNLYFEVDDSHLDTLKNFNALFQFCYPYAYLATAERLPS